MPKNFCQINGKVGLEYIIEECIDAGSKRDNFYNIPKKRKYQKYFTMTKFYTKIIKKKRFKNY